MAYAALDSIVEQLDRMLDHEINSDRCISCYAEDSCCDYCFFLRSKKQEIQYLHGNVVSLLDFVAGFPLEVGNFEARITNAAEQAIAFFEDHYFAPDDEYDLKMKLALQMLEQLIDETDCILKEATQIKRGSKTHDSCCFAAKGKGTIVGFEKELLELKGRIFGELSQLETIPIVGMGGIGKTTLARYVYDDTIHHFDVRAWMTVSQNCSATTILLSVMSVIDPSNKNRYQCMNMESLVQHGYRYLKKRRYLIVMDDLWDTNVWDDVKRAFPDDFNGSRIVITTRSLDVASYVDSSNQPLVLQLMSKAQSWRLLKEVVFGQESCPPELEETGKLIAKKCGGLPLAIVVIAGVLSKLNPVQELWEKIGKNVCEAVNTSEEHISDILSVSYMHLPHHLRPCFLYMGCFPEDYEISVSKLIRLWVGEGFLVSNESKDMEELGYDYLDDLAKRSLVLIEKKSYNGKMKVLKIHDLLRDLCLRKGRDENFLRVINDFSGSFPQGIENSHRLSICSNVWGCIPNMDCALIHTILIFFRHWAFDYWKNFRLLRVLDVTTVALETFGAEITELIHLRYLALAFENQRKFLCLEVPESLSKLQSLQTLFITRLRDYFGFRTILPIAIWRMPELRHIMLLDGSLPENFYEALPLGNLQTLSRIENFTCSEMMLDMLQNLKKLGISYDIVEAGWSQYGLNNLVHLHKLEKMNLYVPPYLCSKSDLAQNVAFPVSLKKLTLTGCRLPWEGMTIVGSLPNLEVLKLKREACDGATWETTEGEFCQLKVLLIENTGLHQWIAESSHFPSLERLTLYECNELEEIPSDIGEIPTLQLIEVDVRNSSVVQSAKYIQEEQQSFGNELQVSLLKPRSFDWSKIYPLPF